MLVGVCEKCRYTDLIEGTGTICPRCGANIVSLGIGSAEWNRMSYPDRQSLIDSKIDKEADDTEEFEKAIAEVIDIPKQPPENETSKQSSERETAKQPSEENESQESLAEEEVNSGNETVTDSTDEQIDRIRESKRGSIYICYKCDKVVSHDDEAARYYCPECGSDMIWTGFSTEEWGKLSIRAKHNATENAKIRYIESKIKKSEFKG